MKKQGVGRVGQRKAGAPGWVLCRVRALKPISSPGPAQEARALTSGGPRFPSHPSLGPMTSNQRAVSGAVGGPSPQILGPR